MKTTAKNKAILYIYALIIILASYIGVMFLKGANLFSFNNNIYYTIYDRANINTSDGVYINNILVGFVTKTELLKPDFRLKVFFNLQKSLVLTDKCKATLRPSGIIPGQNSTILIDFSKELGNPIKPYSEIPGVASPSFTWRILNNTIPIMDSIRYSCGVVNEITRFILKNQLKINSTIETLDILTSNVRKYLSQNKNIISYITHNSSNMIKLISSETKGLSPIITILNKMLYQFRKIDIYEIDSYIKNIRGFLADVQQPNTIMHDIFYKKNIYNNINKKLENLNELFINMRAAPHKYLYYSVISS